MSSENIETPPPFISIGLPTYNRPAFTRLALQSCLEQDYPHFEVIVSDDSQDDQVRRIVDSLGSEKVRYIKNEPALGIPAKLNDLLNRAKGPWMVLLGDDDLFEPGYLSTVAALIRRHPDAALIHTRCRQIDMEGKLLHVDKKQAPSTSPAEFLVAVFQPWYEMRVSITGFVFPLQTMKRLGGFLDLYMGYFIDNIAWAMLGAQGTSYFEEAPLVTLRENPSAISRSFVSDHKKLISSREMMAGVVAGLFDGLSAKAASPAEQNTIETGRAQFKECLLEDTADFLDRIFVQTLRKTAGPATAEMENIYEAVRSSKLPFLSMPHFRRRFQCYRTISAWPSALRILALEIYRKSRSLRIILTGPRTFAERTQYYRTRLRPPKDR